MDMDELKDKYKGFPIWGRLAGVALLALAPAGWAFYDESGALDEKLTAAQTQETAARSAFERDRTKRGNGPKLEEQMAFTTAQLAKARKKLPEVIHIEDILQKTAAIARETGVKLRSFKPLKESKGGDEFKYFEVPVATEINGKFAQIASFYDRVVHLEGSVYLRKIDIAPSDNLRSNSDTAKISDAEIARRERAALTLDAKFEIVMFRAMTDAEMAQAEADALVEAAKLKKKPGDPPNPTPPPPAAATGAAAPAAPTALNETTVIGGKLRL